MLLKWPRFGKSGVIPGMFINHRSCAGAAIALAVFIAVSAASFTAAASDATDRIGTVKKIAGAPVAVREGKPLDLKVGDAVHALDKLKTGKDAALGVTLIDDTVLSLNENSELTLDEMVYEPLDGKLSLSTQLLKGAFVFVSGRIGHLAPQNVAIRTPDAVIGIRGTRFAVRVGE